MFTKTITKTGELVIANHLFIISFTYNLEAPAFISITGNDFPVTYGLNAKVYPESVEEDLQGIKPDIRILEQVYNTARQFFTSYDDV